MGYRKPKARHPNIPYEQSAGVVFVIRTTQLGSLFLSLSRTPLPSIMIPPPPPTTSSRANVDDDVEDCDDVEQPPPHHLTRHVVSHEMQTPPNHMDSICIDDGDARIPKEEVEDDGGRHYEDDDDDTDAEDDERILIPIEITTHEEEDEDDEEEEDATFLGTMSLFNVRKQRSNGYVRRSHNGRCRRRSCIQRTNITNCNTILTMMVVGVVLMVLFVLLQRLQHENVTMDLPSPEEDTATTNTQEDSNINITTPESSSSSSSSSTELFTNLLRERLRQAPSPLLVLHHPSTASTSSSMEQQFTLVPQQFVHLHHMKTGGTSMDDLIKCSVQRIQNMLLEYTITNHPNSTTATTTMKEPPPHSQPLVHIRVPYTTIHECNEAHYKECTSSSSSRGITLLQQQRQTQCIQQVSQAAILSYCAPLHDLQHYFQWRRMIMMMMNQTIPLPPSSLSSSIPSSSSSSSWTTETNPVAPLSSSSLPIPPPVYSITILRHPVARVWSMYRFQTKACYSCRTLKDIYEEIDQAMKNTNSTNDTTTKSTTLRNICQAQLMNHQTRNLLSSTLNSNTNSNPDMPTPPSTTEQLEEAIYNMRHSFTMIGLTEDMKNTAIMAGKVFPWLAENIPLRSSTTYTDDDDQNQNNTSVIMGWDNLFRIVEQSSMDDRHDDDGDGTGSTTTTPVPNANLHVSSSSSSSSSSCPLLHKNASPLNNRCGPHNSHLPLPDAPPDDATIQLILQHNALDVQLYQAAVEQFALQQRILLGGE
jgi:hypothetical protein